MEPTIADLRAKLAYSGLRQSEVAAQMSIHYSLLAKILTGDRPMPEGFPERFQAALQAAAAEKVKHLQAVAAGEPEKEPVPA